MCSFPYLQLLLLFFCRGCPGRHYRLRLPLRHRPGALRVQHLTAGGSVGVRDGPLAVGVRVRACVCTTTPARDRKPESIAQQRIVTVLRIYHQSNSRLAYSIGGITTHTHTHGGTHTHLRKSSSTSRGTRGTNSRLLAETFPVYHPHLRLTYFICQPVSGGV